ncbi:hypothetical protein FGD67_06360 [Colwellia sp. M166]|uniref:hypothetical protein n=1 Tax=Colwellia sp. M166 TaxID=2583805 RepID=UPI00211EF420|nr:hypothetical protein [Colwellia sp. M166]UUO22852.1 hypothetical protein FGD67_06360 [Colwellia sp. M166]
MKKNIKKECEKFCAALGSKEWSEIQTNSMQSSFYSGALTAFILFSELSASENEDIAVTQVQALYEEINKNITEQQQVMQKIWNKKKHH